MFANLQVDSTPPVFLIRENIGDFKLCARSRKIDDIAEKTTSSDRAPENQLPCHTPIPHARNGTFAACSK